MISLIENSGTPADSTVPFTGAIFKEGGWLQDALDLQHRPQQTSMANAVAKAFANDTSLFCEAGTGVGKSLAYLIPGIIRAVSQNRKFIVATHTIPLQSQIKDNDLPKCRTLFSTLPDLRRFGDFKVALLLGKSNYLCATRLQKALVERAELFASEEQAALKKVQEWAQITKTGIRGELSGAIPDEVWDWVNADSTVCNSKNCTPEICPYQRAKSRLASANIIILNHALLFALIAAGVGDACGNSPGVLFPRDFLVLDEAHCVPDVATAHFGATVTAFALDKQLKKLWNSSTKKGLFSIYNKQNDTALIANAHAASETFFNEIEWRFLEKNFTHRLREKNWIAPHLNIPLMQIHGRVRQLSENETDNNRRSELTDIAERVAAINNTLNDAIALAGEPDYFYYLERSGAKKKNVAVHSAPLDVAPLLRKNLFERDTGVILTSATLSNGTDMERFKNQTGAIDIRELRETSPFDYKKNLEIFVAEDAPEPSAGKDGARDTDWFAETVEHCVEAVPGGGTLVLCTSHNDVKKIAWRLEEFLPAGRKVFTQKKGVNRTKLVQDFAENGTGVLVGTDSFWTGIDVPGVALSQVILVRLPFANLSDPVVSARMEWLVTQGKKPFFEMTLPDALIKFRQGVGRLIRKIDDRGRLVILDSRMLTKSYGRQFVAALPHKNFQRFSSANIRQTLPVYH